MSSGARPRALAALLAFGVSSSSIAAPSADPIPGIENVTEPRSYDELPRGFFCSGPQ